MITRAAARGSCCATRTQCRRHARTTRLGSSSAACGRAGPGGFARPPGSSRQTSVQPGAHSPAAVRCALDRGVLAHHGVGGRLSSRHCVICLRRWCPAAGSGDLARGRGRCRRARPPRSDRPAPTSRGPARRPSAARSRAARTTARWSLGQLSLMSGRGRSSRRTGSRSAGAAARRTAPGGGPVGEPGQERHPAGAPGLERQPVRGPGPAEGAPHATSAGKRRRRDDQNLDRNAKSDLSDLSWVWA